MMLNTSQAMEPTTTNSNPPKTISSASRTGSVSIYPIQPDEFLPTVKRWTSIGGTVLALSVMAAFGLAAVSKFNVTVRANAIVRPSGELRLVQSQLEGTVKQIVVQENQSIRRGDVIAYLDDTQLQLHRSQLESNIQQDRLQLTQVIAQIRSLNNQIAAETSAINRMVAASEAELARAEREHRDRQVVTEADVRESEAALEQARDEYHRYQQLLRAGAIAVVQVKQRESAMKVAAAKLMRARAGLQPTTAPIAIAQEQIAQQQAKGVSILAALTKDREAMIQQQVQLQQQQVKHQKDLQQLERSLQQTTLRATSDGIILKLTLRNPGQVVRPGEAIAQISPAEAPLEIKASVASQDISKVKVGQQVQLRVAACPYPDYGVLQGRVKAISPDAIPAQPVTAEERTTQTSAPSPTGYFETTVQPDRLELVNGMGQCAIQPGMEAKADIISREETVLQYVLRKARLLMDL